VRLPQYGILLEHNASQATEAGSVLRFPTSRCRIIRDLSESRPQASCEGAGLTVGGAQTTLRGHSHGSSASTERDVFCQLPQFAVAVLLPGLLLNYTFIALKQSLALMALLCRDAFLTVLTSTYIKLKRSSCQIFVSFTLFCSMPKSQRHSHCTLHGIRSVCHAQSLICTRLRPFTLGNRGVAAGLLLGWVPFVLKLLGRNTAQVAV
jgi:hypothetical protein